MLIEDVNKVYFGFPPSVLADKFQWAQFCNVSGTSGSGSLTMNLKVFQKQQYLLVLSFHLKAKNLGLAL